MKQVTIIFLLFSFSYSKILVAQQDSIKQNLGLKDGQTIVSASGIFELGFFSPNNSQNRFLGIWYKKISSGTVVWVANRNAPLPQKSGVLTVTPEGNLGIVVNLTNTTVWSSNSSASSGKISPVAQLLDTGNLVVKDGNEDKILWQSFDYPTDTLLPDMKFGINKTAGIDMSLTSWSSNSNDLALGEFTYRCHPQGYPQFFITRGSDKIYRFGNWNGITFSGLRQSKIMNVTFVFTHMEVYYTSSIVNNSVLTRLVLNQKGVAERQAWFDGKWDVLLKGPADNCDYYGRCGRYGSCNIANSPICECLKEFVPKSPRDWNIGNFSNGCVREKPLDCQNGDRFLNYSNIKLPDTESCWSKETTTLKECEILCSRNCSCTGYTTLDIRKGSGCLLWFDDLIDIRQVTDGGQFIFIRMAASKLGGNKGRKKETILVYVLILPIGTLLLGLSFISYMLWKKKKRQLQRNNEGLQSDSRQLQLRESQQEDLELPLIGLGTIQKATSNFSIDNKLGEGGFGPVYKGVLEDGKEIAVKRLSKDSRQGTDEFKNEVVCIAKLQHRNLVKLIGCCIQDEEKMLIYEYMPNKGLDFFIFDETRNKLLDWTTRLSIINGIARGLLYLHQDSRLRVIHRDLKLSNILLDKDLNPKISDFGMARIFRGDETHANTLRVVGTYGYMSPEYQLDGLFSVKSDVFSFGVLVLEIASGKRNRGFVHPDHHHNLLGHAWKLFKEGTLEELIGDESGYKSHSSEILRSIHISLLCIQQNPEDRPNMSYVVMMLGSDSILPQPKQPGFFTERNGFVSDTSTSHNSPFSCNEVTITLLQGR